MRPDADARPLRRRKPCTQVHFDSAGVRGRRGGRCNGQRGRPLSPTPPSYLPTFPPSYMYRCSRVARAADGVRGEGAGGAGACVRQCVSFRFGHSRPSGRVGAAGATLAALCRSCTVPFRLWVLNLKCLCKAHTSLLNAQGQNRRKYGLLTALTHRYRTATAPLKRRYRSATQRRYRAATAPLPH